VKLGLFAPLPPARTGVADYAAALRAALSAHGEVEVGAADADVCLYHLGNNALHREAYEASLRRPGVVVLHDAVLHHYLLGTLTREAYLDEFAYNYGEWSRSLAAELWAGRHNSAQDERYFRHALVRRAAEAARAVVVHNPAAARIVAAHAPAARIVEIPHLWCGPAPDPFPGRWRAARGIAPATFLFGVFGHLRESKRLPAVLRAFEDLRGCGADAALLVAGAFVSTDLERALAPRLDQPGVLRLGYLDAAEFRAAASAVDACINLRYPAAGETSGIAVRMMGLAKPVLLTAGEENARWPEAACLRIDQGVAERPMLKEYMKLLIVSRDTAREIGRRAAAHIAEHHSQARIARRYWELLCALT
jgi:glycosyltransferase involved in cell wall biosynthesis